MSVLRILPIQHPSLQRVCSRVKGVGPSVRKLMGDLEETMLSANGVGLAAPQVGKPLRVIAVLEGERAFSIANPEIVRASGESVAEEGCLSLPLFFGPVPRHDEITVRGLDEHGKKIRRKATGLLARAIQHEIDHLNGVLFKDRLAEGAELRFARPQSEPVEEQAAG